MIGSGSVGCSVVGCRYPGALLSLTPVRAVILGDELDVAAGRMEQFRAVTKTAGAAPSPRGRQDPSAIPTRITVCAYGRFEGGFPVRNDFSISSLSRLAFSEDSPSRKALPRFPIDAPKLVGTRLMPGATLAI